MKKYKVIKEKRQLTDDEIEGLKSFSQLTQSYQRATRRPTVPVYKNKWAFIALVIIVLLLLWISGEL
ncbi:MAG TPA: hypothetical protein VD905_16030 [Flavobacteriales bacterium]|nr:hypothetical protein [Flavobacteriales bacterium]